jgi:hypothetical protein
MAIDRRMHANKWRWDGDELAERIEEKSIKEKERRDCQAYDHSNATTSTALNFSL